MSDVARPRRPASPPPVGPPPPGRFANRPYNRSGLAWGGSAPPAPRPRPGIASARRAGAHRRCAATGGATLRGVGRMSDVARPRRPASPPPAAPTPRAVREPPLQRERPCVGWGAPPAPRPRPGIASARRAGAHQRCAATAWGVAWEGASAMRGYNGRGCVGGRMSDVARPRRPASPRPGGPPHPGRFANRPYNGSGLAWGGARPRPHVPAPGIASARRAGAHQRCAATAWGVAWEGASAMRGYNVGGLKRGAGGGIIGAYEAAVGPRAIP